MVIRMEIQNIVASVDFKRKLPLDKLSRTLEKSEYQPEQFPGLIYRIDEPKAAFLIFQSGKIICVGSKSIKAVALAFKELSKKLRKSKTTIPRKFKIVVENIVATDKIAKELNLDDIVFKLKETEYEPDTFPGVIYRLQDPKASFLLFSSGKIVCAGARKASEIKKAILILKKRLREIKAI